MNEKTSSFFCMHVECCVEWFTSHIPPEPKRKRSLMMSETFRWGRVRTNIEMLAFIIHHRKKRENIFRLYYFNVPKNRNNETIFSLFSSFYRHWIKAVNELSYCLGNLFNQKKKLRRNKKKIGTEKLNFRMNAVKNWFNLFRNFSFSSVHTHQTLSELFVQKNSFDILVSF